MRYSIVCGAAVLSAIVADARAAGLSSETWVAGSGTDSGACAVSAPCATFRYAVTQTAAGGAVHVASSGSYGTVTLRKAVSILAPDGIEAVITVPAKQTGVTVDAGSGTIILRNLHITGAVVNGNFGITVNSVGSLTIDHVTVTNQQFGIYATNGFVLVKSSTINDNTYGVADYGSNTYMGQTTVSGNAEGIVGAALNSYGDNDMNGNTECDVCATINEMQHDQ